MPSALAALTLTRRACGATPAMMPARCVPWPKASRWRSAGSRRSKEKSGPLTTLPGAARSPTGVMPESISATSTPSPPASSAVGADRSADLGERGRVGGRAVGGGAGLAEQRVGVVVVAAGLERAVDDDRADAAGAAHRAHRARGDPGDHAVDQPHAVGDLAAGGLDGGRGALADDDHGHAAVAREARRRRGRASRGARRSGRRRDTSAAAASVPANAVDDPGQSAGDSSTTRRIWCSSGVESIRRMRLVSTPCRLRRRGRGRTSEPPSGGLACRPGR